MMHSRSVAKPSRADGPAGSRVARPPWAVDEASFALACTACGDCVRACPSALLKPGSDHHPQIDFTARGCDFCGDCLRACRHGALVGDVTATATAFAHRVALGDLCLADWGIGCQVCGTFCASGAIAFAPRLGAPPIPTLDLARCTGCGSCIAPCPAGAIRLTHPHRPGPAAFDG